MGLFIKKTKTKRDSSQRGRRSQDSSENKRVISYYTATKKQINSSERQMGASQKDALYERHIRNIKKWWFVTFVSIVIIAIFGYLISLSGEPYVAVDGPMYRTRANYQDSVSKIISSNMINHIKPLVPVASIQEKILNNLPEVSSATVSTSLFSHRLNVRLITDSPAAILTQPGQQDLIVSNRGRLLIPANNELKTDTSKLPIVQNQSGITAKAGEQFIRPDEMAMLLKLNEQVSTDNSVANYVIPTTPHEIWMYEPNRGGYYTRFLLDETILNQYGALRATQKKLSEIGQTPTQYIDIRLTDKAYYK